MTETPTETVNRVFRENKRYTDDGLPNPPTGAPLPVGDPASGVWNPKKVHLREALLAPITAAAQSASDAADSATASEQSHQDAEADADRAQTYAAMLSVDRIKFNTVPALIADTSMGYANDDPTPAIIVGPGDIIEAQGFRYEVVASDAADYHVQNGGEVRMKVLPVGNFYPVLAFGAAGDYDSGTGTGTDDTVPLQTAINAALDVGLNVDFHGLHYRTTDTISLLNENYNLLSVGLFGSNGNRTRIYFDNDVSMKNMFLIDENINYFQFKGIELIDKTGGTSRAFSFKDTRQSTESPSWKHYLEDFRVFGFAEGARFDGAATTANDAHLSEVMMLHGKFRNCRKGIIYNNTQSVNHQLIGMDFENDDPLDATEKWPHLVFERGSYVNHFGGSVIGYGPYVQVTYPNDGTAFPDTTRLNSDGIRMEGRGDGPFFYQTLDSYITLTNVFRIDVKNLSVVMGYHTDPVLARLGGKLYMSFENCGASSPMVIEGYVTAFLESNSEFGGVKIENCKRISYRRVADQAGYRGSAPSSGTLKAIPAEISHQIERNPVTTTGGYDYLNNDRQTIYSGGWQVSQPKTMVYSPIATPGVGNAENPHTLQFVAPPNARPYKFRILRDDSNAGSAFVFTIYAVTSGGDVQLASITPSSGTGGHFEANLQAGSGFDYYVNDGVNWDGKMKIVKSGTINGFRGLYMVDYM